MVLDRFRSAADAVLVPVARRMAGVNPNAISWAALLAAALAGLSFLIGGTGFLIAALILLLLSAYLDALDGMVARTAGRASRRGDFIDHVFDRYADVFLLGGVTFSAYLSGFVWVGVLALIGVLLTSYMGTQAQAVGQGRLYAGLLGRADRLVLLFLGGLVQLVVSAPAEVAWGVDPLRLQPLGWFLLLFAVLGNATALQRAVTIWRGISG